MYSTKNKKKQQQQYTILDVFKKHLQCYLETAIIYCTCYKNIMFQHLM